MAGRVAAFGLVLVSALLVQSVWGAGLTVLGIRPDIVALTVVGFALAEGPGTGVRYGFAAGVALDLLAPQEHLVGLSALVLVFVGYGVGALRRYLIGGELTAQVTAAAGAAATIALARGVLQLLLGEPGEQVIGLLWSIVGGAAYAALLAPFICRLAQGVAARFPVVAPVG
ncbi:MAG: rod shape-determining protein MreD [Egibacteraceae bacterium]